MFRHYNSAYNESKRHGKYIKEDVERNRLDLNEQSTFNINSLAFPFVRVALVI